MIADENKKNEATVSAAQNEQSEKRAFGTAQITLFSNLAEAVQTDQATTLTRLATNPSGLTWAEARRRVEQFGSNELASQRPPPWPVVLWHALKHPFNGVLTALAAVSFATGDLKAGIVMLSMIVLSAGLRFWQEMKSQVQAESLRKLVHNETTVLRAENRNVERKPNELDRQASDIPTRELVPGDIVKLSAGDMIPADLRLLESRDMFVTQSALTGEAMPADESHLYGHAKIAFFSAGFEGAMIILAALFIIYESIHKWTTGLQLDNLGLGTALTAAAAGINGGLGAYVLVTGRRRNSLILEANGKHVLTDCWTSLAVLAGLALVLITRWLPFDPICGMLMAGNILYSGVGLLKSAWTGLMDTADPATQKQLNDILAREVAKHGLTFHQLRHRNIGDAHWIDVHLVFPGGTALADAHRIATAIEGAVEESFQMRAYVATHLECAATHDELHRDGHS